MLNNWIDAELGEIAEELTVGHVGTMADQYRNEGVPFLRSLNVEPFRINTTDLKFIDAKFHGRLRKSALSPGDVVVVRTGKPGACAVIPDWLPIANCSDLVIIRPGPNLDARFLMYYINSAASGHVDAHLVGAVQQHFNVASARQIKLRLPPLSEQRAIARILGTLDDKIELNRQMNQTLEQIAVALFKSWFIDFDPVRAKAEGRQPEGMDAETAALFPDRLVESEIGEIPEGWTVSTVGAIAEVIDCLHSKKPSRTEIGRPLIQLSNIRDDGLLDMTDTYFISDEDYDRWTSRIEVRQGDCVITNVGRVGAVAQIPCRFFAAIGRNMTAVRPKSDFPYPTWLLQLLTSSWMKQEIVARTDSGTILDALNVRSISQVLDFL